MKLKMKMNVIREKNTLTIIVPVEKPWLSKSGKNLLVASTHGPKMTGALHNGRNISVLMNAYIRPTETEVDKFQNTGRHKHKERGR